MDNLLTKEEEPTETVSKNQPATTASQYQPSSVVVTNNAIPNPPESVLPPIAYYDNTKPIVGATSSPNNTYGNQNASFFVVTQESSLANTGTYGNEYTSYYDVTQASSLHNTGTYGNENASYHDVSQTSSLFASTTAPQLGPPFVCSECENEYALLKRLTEHQRMVHGPSGFSWLRENGKIICEFCGFQYQHLEHFVTHQRSCHDFDPDEKTALKAFCDECREKFTSDDVLEEHKLRVHRAKEGKHLNPFSSLRNIWFFLLSPTVANPSNMV